MEYPLSISLLLLAEIPKRQIDWGPILAARRRLPVLLSDRRIHSPAWMILWIKNSSKFFWNLPELRRRGWVVRRRCRWMGIAPRPAGRSPECIGEETVGDGRAGGGTVRWRSAYRFAPLSVVAALSRRRKGLEKLVELFCFINSYYTFVQNSKLRLGIDMPS